MIWQRPTHWQVRLIQLAAVPGLLLAYYMWLYHDGQLTTLCTSSGWFDCGQVSGPGAPYASIGPIPVALMGFAGYGVIFLLTWGADWSPKLKENLPELLIAIIGFAFLISLGLTALELFVIKAICRYCVVSAIIITFMFILAISYLRQETQA